MVRRLPVDRPGRVPRRASAPTRRSADRPCPRTGYDQNRIQKQVHSQAGLGAVPQGGGTLYTEPVLVVNQKTKLIEINNEYSIFDQHGTADRRRAPGRPEHGEEGRPGPHLDGPVLHPHAADRRRARQRRARGHPAPQGREVAVPRRRTARAASSARSSRTTSSARSTSRSSPAATRSARSTRRTGGPGSSTSRTTRRRGGPHHEDVGGPVAHDLHHRRQLRGADPPPARRAAAHWSLASALTVDTALKQDSRGFG